MSLFKNSSTHFRVGKGLLLSLFYIATAACASLGGDPAPQAERYVSCPQEAVWEGALETLKSYPVKTKDKEDGLIETDWRERPVQGRRYGLFSREGLGEKERAQLTMSLKPLDHGVTRVRLTERRQHWGFRGGGQIYAWYPVEPSQEALDKVMNSLTVKLDKEGCISET